MTHIKAAVIGHPISHSKSPRLHGHWLTEYDIDGSYVPIDISPNNLTAGLQDMIARGFAGTNVTIPHKEKVLEIADQVTDTAKAIGAANTLTFLPDGKIHADNTDAVGFLENLAQSEHKWKAAGKNVIILGAGGASRAIIHGLKSADANSIGIANRTRSKSENMVSDFGDIVHVIDWENVEESFSETDILINTTSLGMAGQPPLEMSISSLRPDALVTDIVYTPLMTPLLEMAKARGNPIVDGLGMLLHQAAPGFHRWFGRNPEVTENLRQVLLA